MASKGPQIALSFFAVIAIPVLVGQATETPQTESTPAAEAKPAAKKAALTIQLGSAEQESSDVGRIRIRAAAEPPTGTTLLTSADGSKLVRAKSRPSADCETLPVHHASQAPGGEDWCISLDGIDGGSAVTGLLTGKAKAAGEGETELALTVNRRTGFWGEPLLVILGGFLLGILAILAPRFARRKTRTAILDNLLEENESALPGRSIEGLTEWVTAQRSASSRKSDDELLPVVFDLVKRAPEIAKQARAELARAVGASGLPSSLAAVKAADKELQRQALKRSDFFADDGTAAVHPARELAGVLTQLGIQGAHLAELHKKVESLPDDERRKAGKAALEKADVRFRTAVEPEQVTELLKLFDAVEQAIAMTARESADTRVASLSLAAPQLAVAPFAGHEIAVALPLQGKTTLSKRLGRLVWPALLTIFAVGLAAAIAVLTIKLSSYDAKPAFGSTADYLALLVAATGSGAAATILANISFWDPLSPAESA